MVEEDSTAVSISVTPCQARLQWKLSLHELPEDGSGSSKLAYFSSCKSDMFFFQKINVLITASSIKRIPLLKCVNIGIIE